MYIAWLLDWLTPHLIENELIVSFGKVVLNYDLCIEGGDDCRSAQNKLNFLEKIENLRPLS